MNEKNSEKVVVVTGCSSGIGRCTAEMLSAHGYHVIATVRKFSDGAELRLKDTDALVEMELASEPSVESAVEKILELANGKLYAIFNNAAYGQPGAVEDLTRAALSKQFEVNVFGTHQFTRGLIPALLEQERAHIIQCSSVLGLIGMPMRGAYVASKFALEGLTDTLRMELSDSNIQVSLIEPGPIHSEFRKNALEALEQNVDFDESRHGWRYLAAVTRLSAQSKPSKYKLGPETVAAKVIHALEAKRAQDRYYVTQITVIIGYLKRFMSSRMLDRLLLKYAKDE